MMNNYSEEGFFGKGVFCVSYLLLARPCSDHGAFISHAGLLLPSFVSTFPSVSGFATPTFSRSKQIRRCSTFLFFTIMSLSKIRTPNRLQLVGLIDGQPHQQKMFNREHQNAKRATSYDTRGPGTSSTCRKSQPAWCIVPR
jgi:hypothetical protein